MPSATLISGGGPLQSLHFCHGRLFRQERLKWFIATRSFCDTSLGLVSSLQEQEPTGQRWSASSTLPAMAACPARSQHD